MLLIQLLHILNRSLSVFVVVINFVFASVIIIVNVINANLCYHIRPGISFACLIVSCS